eukprot:TRINITY_DN10161_c0_g1_i1.p1 TRINITY_DN10161_c0_g1~~TRINITY_DN10161_c0_g1_i1.p1  ORF type:complete len:329 (-),score=74.46 TRINITY_DN10161_c0_g1_i1:39-1025(-)
MCLKILKFISIFILLAVSLLIGWHMKASSDFDLKIPGKLIKVGFYGQKLHVYCKGPKNSNYTVIFLHGMGQSFADFTNVQLNLEKQGIYSCSYDRPGYGFSPKPQNEEVLDLKMQMDLLNQLIHKGGIISENSKLILVGHSLGGLQGLYYSNKYPQDLQGLVLMDPSMPSFSKELKEKLGSLEVFFKLAEYFGNLGIMRLMVKDNGVNLPSKSQNENNHFVAEFLKRGQTFEMSNKEYRAWIENALTNLDGLEKNKNIKVTLIKPSQVIKNPMLDEYTNSLIYSEMQNYYKEYFSGFSGAETVEVEADHVTMLMQIDFLTFQILKHCV